MASIPRSYAVVATAVLVFAAGLVGAVAVSQPSPVSAQEEPANDSTTQRTSSACDYASLYDQTNDAVVSVRTGSGQGSGFVYDQVGENGSYVVTNAHVVGDAATVTLQFAGEETREVEVVGRDRLTDLAVVQVSDTPRYVQALPVADERPHHGTRVAALGNPFGLEETITHGIVSGLNRSMPTQFGFAVPDTIQTDAPISAGNSGGPLVTCEGTVVGVNSAGISSPRAENIGFAVSQAIVQEVVPDLIERGEYAHPYLGVRVAPVTPEVAPAYGLDEPRGLVVLTVADTPATDALQGATGQEVVSGQRIPVGGDVIVAINGSQIDSPEDLSSTLITQTEPGSTVPVTIVRDGERMTVEVPVTERPDPTDPSSER